MFDIRAVLQFADALGMPRAALLPLVLADPDAGLAAGAGSGTGMDVDRRDFGGLAAGAAAAVILPAASAPLGVSSSHLRYWQACANALYGRLLFNVLGMIAEFESDLIRMRTREGMKVAKAKGRLRGKQPKLKPAQEAHLIELWRAGKHTSAELAELFSVARSTIYRAVQRADEPTSAA